ncbi:MAG: alpha-E domain-containing protein [Pseudomonadota bacterium]
MLSRTAENLYWIGRYVERAETMARLLEVGERISLVPNAASGYRNEWESILQASGVADGFWRKYDTPVQRNLESYLFFDRSNASSVASCLERARENARVVRTALTVQVWDALNTGFQELRALEREARSDLPLSRLTDWTRQRTALVRGTIETSQLRNDGYFFLKLGEHLERADNTARLLDVKYHVLLPSVDYVGTGFDNAQWATLLRALSVHRSFNWAYGGEVNVSKIADFLILNPACPRSLRWCLQSAVDDLDRIAHGYDGTTAAQNRAGTTLTDLKKTHVDNIFAEGMHEFLTRFIDSVANVNSSIQADYLSGNTG